MTAPQPDLLDAWRHLWVNRSQPYALQQADGTYRWVRRILTDELLRAHLAGETTLALSSTDARGWCRWLCLDADASESLPQLLALRSALAAHDLTGVVEASRRGGHLWILLEELVPAAEARWMVVEALEQIRASGAIAVPSCELYPTASVPDTLGHPVHLPLGIHRLTGRRYALFDERGYPCAFTSTDAALRFVLDVPRIPASVVQRAWGRFQGGEATHQSRDGAPPEDAGEISPPVPAPGHTGTTSVVIRRVGQGWLGWCPFHDDRASDALGRPGTPSFYVVLNWRHGWSWRCLSSNCAHSVGPMRHSFRLYRELLRLEAPAAIRAAVERWPAIEGACGGSEAPPLVAGRVEGDDDPEHRATAPDQRNQGGGDAQGS